MVGRDLLCLNDGQRPSAPRCVMVSMVLVPTLTLTGGDVIPTPSRWHPVNSPWSRERASG